MNKQELIAYYRRLLESDELILKIRAENREKYAKLGRYNKITPSNLSDDFGYQIEIKHLKKLIEKLEAQQ